MTQRDRRSGRGRRSSAGRRRSTSRKGRYRAAAEGRLRRFRQGSILAIAVTALLLLLIGQPAPAETVAPVAAGQVAVDTSAPATETSPQDPADAAREATGTLRDLALDAYGALPVIGIAVLILMVAAILSKLLGLLLGATLRSWTRSQAAAALVSVFVWLVAIGAALTVLTGDGRALVGSVGLFGLALSWALQAPIESFTGWLLNSFRSYYRIGDRIAVGDVFGDVASIDFLTTTVFEAGGPDKPVQAAQSTGATVTFPNLEVLRSNIVNFTRDFPYVWDELTVSVANESDLPLAVKVLEETTDRVLGERMHDAAVEYGALLDRVGLGWDVATRPEVFVSLGESWTSLTVRYLVPAREMRRWSSRLLLAANQALGEPPIANRVFPAYPRKQVQPLPLPGWAEDSGDAAGRPASGPGDR